MEIQLCDWTISFCMPVEGQRRERGGESKGVVNKWQTHVQIRISLELTSYHFLHGLLGPLLCTWTLTSPPHLCWCSAVSPTVESFHLLAHNESLSALHLYTWISLYPGPLLLPPASPDSFKSHSSVLSQAREVALDPSALGSCPSICSHSSLGFLHCTT